MQNATKELLMRTINARYRDLDSMIADREARHADMIEVEARIAKLDAEIKELETDHHIANDPDFEEIPLKATDGAGMGEKSTGENVVVTIEYSGGGKVFVESCVGETIVIRHIREFVK